MAMFVFSVFLTLMLSGPGLARRDLPDHLLQQILAQKDDVDRITEYLLEGAGRHQTYERLAAWTDKHGHRLVGSIALDNSIDQLIDNFGGDGMDNVHGENVTCPLWVRGADTLTLLEPRVQQLDLLALGSSVSGDVTADVIVVKNFRELNQLHQLNETQGKVVVYNQRWLGYGPTMMYRMVGASRAARAGAVGALVRSLTGHSLYTPHTGGQSYNDAYPKIPVAAITVEDAEILQRMQERGEVIRVRLNIESHPDGDTVTRNVVAEIRGSQLPEQVVAFGGHVDSWDVGTGSMDDGGGVAISRQVLTVVKALGLTPKRTLRFIGWSAEENGVHGGNAYRDQHQSELGQMSLIMESDSGTFLPRGVGFSGSGLARAIMEEIVETYLGDLNATVVGVSGRAPDSGPLITDGVPGVSLLTHNDKYFDYHHTRADTMTVEDPDELDRCSVVWTVVAYVVANLDDILPRVGDYPEGPDPTTTTTTSSTATTTSISSQPSSSMSATTTLPSVCNTVSLSPCLHTCSSVIGAIIMSIVIF